MYIVNDKDIYSNEGRMIGHLVNDLTTTERDTVKEWIKNVETFLNDIQEAREEGHRDGYGEGYDDGYSEGHKDGYDDGFNEALKIPQDIG